MRSALAANREETKSKAAARPQSAAEGLQMGGIARPARGPAIVPAAGGCEGGERLSCHEILIRALRVRLPWPPDEMRQTELPVQYGSYAIEFSIERTAGALLSGSIAGKSTSAPMDFRIANETGAPQLTVPIHWSLWTDPQQPGWEDLKRAEKRLEKAHSRCAYNEIAGIGPGGSGETTSL